jgi:hypothetical protein
MKYLALAVTFISLFACESMSRTKFTDAPKQDQAMTTSNQSAGDTIDAANHGEQKIAGSIPLTELIHNKGKYDGQTVKVQGRVIKLNNMIMKKNWVHIQDASVQSENTDLTITTIDNVAVGDVVAFEGKIAVNKDFGSGYKYEIIMEDANLIK